MRSNRSISICLCVSSLGLMWLFSSSVWPQESKRVNPRIKELQQKRLAALEKMHDVSQRLFKNARVAFEELHDASVEYFNARRDYAETREERLQACDDAMKEAMEWVEYMQTRKASARASEMQVLKAEAYLLEVQIARENILAGE